MAYAAHSEVVGFARQPFVILEGELLMLAVPGAIPEKFYFTVREES